MTFHLEALADQDLSGFDSGRGTLDTWLRDYATTATGQGTRTYVLLDDDRLVIGYFAVAPHVLERETAPRNIGRGAPHQIPAVLLAKLALDQSVQGRGLGAELLVRALALIIEAARAVGGRVIIVDAIDAAAFAFYEHHDFKRLPGRTDRLIMKLSTAAKALGVTWP